MPKKGRLCSALRCSSGTPLVIANFHLYCGSRAEHNRRWMKDQRDGTNQYSIQ